MTTGAAQAAPSSSVSPVTTSTSILVSVEGTGSLYDAIFVTEGTTVTYYVTVSPNVGGGTVDGGTVMFSDAATGPIPQCTAVRVGDSAASCTITYSYAATHKVSASYSGDSDDASSSSTLDASVEVVPATSTTMTATAGDTTSSSSLTVVAGTPVTFDAVVAPNPGEGFVSWWDTAVGTVPDCNSVNIDPTTGDASCTETFTSLGVHKVTGEYGDSLERFAQSASNTLTVNVVTKTTLSLQASSAQANGTAIAAGLGTKVTYTATINPIPSGTSITSADAGTVAFSDNGSIIAGCGDVEFNLATGTATCTTSYASAGRHIVEASFAGDTLFASASSNAVFVAVGTPTVTTLEVGATGQPEGTNIAVGSGTPITYVATVAPVPVGGTVSFTDKSWGAVQGCVSVPVNPTTGQATCSITHNAAGDYDVTATFSGDSSSLASTSDTTEVTVTQPVQSPSAPVWKSFHLARAVAHADVQVTTASAVTVRIENRSGRVLRVIALGQMSRGTHIVVFRVGELAPGAYQLVVVSVVGRATSAIRSTVHLYVGKDGSVSSTITNKPAAST